MTTRGTMASALPTRRTRRARRRFALGLALLAALASLGLSGCARLIAGGSPDAIIIGTTNFSETRILANMYQQMLQSVGIDAVVKELTTREVIIPAMEKDQLQLTPEYLGSFTEFLNKNANGPDASQLATGDVAKTLTQARKLAAPVGLAVLEPSPAQDQNAFAVTAAFASEHNLKSLSDLAAYSQQHPIVLGGPPECPSRPFCQAGLEQVYGVKVGKFVPLDAGGPLTIQSLTQGTIQVGLVFSSSAAVVANNLVLLTDDEGLQTSENVTPVMNDAAVTPEATAALNRLSKTLTTDELATLNQQVELDRMDPKVVAEQYLQVHGLIGPTGGAPASPSATASGG